MAANGLRSDSRQRRISSRSVRMLSKVAVTCGSVAARALAGVTVIEGGWLLALSLILLAGTVWLVRRKAA
jgi:hypothetical protein